MGKIEELLVHLHLIDQVGPASIARVYDQLRDRLCDIYTFNTAQLCAMGLSQDVSERIRQGLQDRQRLDEALDVAHRNNYRILIRWHKGYPDRLAAIHQPPTALFVQGQIPEVPYALAIVGSRQADRYAQAVIQEVIACVPKETVIVSGGALGADTYAHRAAVQCGLPTVVVMGSGLRQPYPRENTQLFQDIVQAGGALVSSFYPQARPLPVQFPARNRIIAGLAQATLVVQAAAKSGALITASFAVQEGREVGAVPGLITHPLSAGCHHLIQQGAYVLDSPEAILDLLNIKTKSARTQQQAIPGFANQDPVVAACGEPMSIDELMVRLDMDMTALFERLSAAELAGTLTQTLSGQWVKTQD